MKKMGLLTLICVFTLLIGGCAKNVDSTPLEDSSEAISESPEVQSDMPEPAEQDTELSGQDAEIPEQDVELSGQDAEIPEQGIELSEQDVELINMGILNNEHNVYMGSIGNKEIRMMITRTDDSLSAAYITRDGEEKAFQGELKRDSAGFILNTDSGDYLEGTISTDDNGGISVNGVGAISANEVVFTLRQDTFFPVDEDTENYYASLGYAADEAEQFAQRIKDSINDKTAFAGLIQYPISIEMDGSQIMIENEESMIDTYDRLMEQNSFKQQMENIYTKYMFANYMGVCVEDGIMWFDMDSSGDYKITAINPPSTDIVLTDEHKSLLQTMCYYMPDFSGVTLMEDERFWRNFIYSSFTNVPMEYGKYKPIYGEGEYVMVYREDWGFEEPAFKISEKYVREYVRLIFGVEMPEFKPAFEDIEENQSVFYYQDGYYYIGGSDFGETEYTFRDLEVFRKQDDTSAIASYDLLTRDDNGEWEVVGTVQFHLNYADNANGFVIVGKEVEYNTL